MAASNVDPTLSSSLQALRFFGTVHHKEMESSGLLVRGVASDPKKIMEFVQGKQEAFRASETQGEQLVEFIVYQSYNQGPKAFFNGIERPWELDERSL